jgi:hypothetical protein
VLTAILHAKHAVAMTLLIVKFVGMMTIPIQQKILPLITVLLIQFVVITVANASGLQLWIALLVALDFITSMHFSLVLCALKVA